MNGYYCLLNIICLNGLLDNLRIAVAIHTTGEVCRKETTVARCELYRHAFVIDTTGVSRGVVGLR